MSARKGEWAIGLKIIGPRLVTERYAYRVGLLHDLFSASAPFFIIAVHRNENSAVSHLPLVTLCLVFRQTHPDERTGQAADRAAHSRSCEHCHNWTGGDERSYPGNCEGADARKPP